MAKPIGELINRAALNTVECVLRGEIPPEQYKLTATEVLAKKPAPPSAPLNTWKLPDDIMARTVPAQRYAVERLLPVECVSGLTGPGKIGKSYLTLLLLLSVAAGRRCLGLEVQQGPAWYFSAEDRADRVMERAQAILADFTDDERQRAIAHFHAIDAVGARLFFVRTVNGAPTITDASQRIADTVGKASLVVVDTVSRINPLRESDNETMALVISAAEVIAQKTGAAVVLNHHVGKAQARGGVSDLYSGRGASSFGDNARSLISLTRADEAAVKTFGPDIQDAQRLGNILILTHSASSYGRELRPMFLRRRDNGTHERIDPVSDLITPLMAWAEEKGIAHFSRKMLCETYARQIWPVSTPSRSDIGRFIDTCLESGAMLPIEGRFRGGPRFRLSPATLEAIEMLDAQALNEIEGEPFD